MVVCEERTIFNGSLPLNVGIFQDQHKTLNMIFTNFQYENAYFFGTKKRPQKTHNVGRCVKFTIEIGILGN
jgi:hypothetical protein